MASWPEHRKKPGVAYATTDDGYELPIIDITHPAFAVDPTLAELTAKAADFEVAQARRERAPFFLAWIVDRLFLGRSVIGSAMIASRTTGFLAGTPTYLLKLGPENLGAYATDIDRVIAGSLPGLSARMRVQFMARLLADGVRSAFDGPGFPIRFVGIAGGPCSDVLNALILLRKELGDGLDGRSIELRVLDPDTAGPAFARRALEALQQPAFPLDGVEVGFSHVAYDWTAPDQLAERVGDVSAAVVAIASEGGLFEYGSDEAIVENLRAIARLSAKQIVVVGSVTGDGDLVRRSQKTTGVRVIPRTAAEFAALTDAAGWTIARLEHAPFCRVGLLRPR